METLVAGQCAFFDLDAQDDATPPVSHNANFTVQVADYSLGYVAKQGGSRIFFVPKQVGTVNVLISGTSADGTPLPTVTITYQTSAIPPVQQATHLVVGPQTIGPVNIGTPGDPGVDNVTGSL